MSETMFERLTLVLHDVDDGVASTTAAAWVLRAMREPTEEMIEAGVSAEFGKTLGDRVANCYRAMIDAALAKV